MAGHLLVLTDDGYAKRIPLEDIPFRRPGAKGIPVRHRRVQRGGRMAKGVRVVRLAAGDRVTACAVAQCPPAAPAALQEGDTVAATLRLAS